MRTIILKDIICVLLFYIVIMLLYTLETALKATLLILGTACIVRNIVFLYFSLKKYKRKRVQINKRDKGLLIYHLVSSILIIVLSFILLPIVWSWILFVGFSIILISLFIMNIVLK